MPTATVTDEGQVTLPKAIRDVLRVHAGDQVDFVIGDQGEVTIRPVIVDITALRGILRQPGQRALSVEEMNEAILREHSGKQ
jgi:antitoxin PrlF